MLEGYCMLSHIRTTPSTECGLQLAAESKPEIVKAYDNNQQPTTAGVSGAHTVSSLDAFIQTESRHSDRPGRVHSDHFS